MVQTKLMTICHTNTLLFLDGNEEIKSSVNSRSALPRVADRVYSGIFVG